MSDQDPLFRMMPLNGDEWVFLIPIVVLVGGFVVSRWARGRPDRRRWDQIATALTIVVAATVLVWTVFFRVDHRV